MQPPQALLLTEDALDDDVAELALRLAMASGDYTRAGAWLVRQATPAPAAVRAVLGGGMGSTLCLGDHRLLPFVEHLEPAEREEVLHGIIDAFRGGRVRVWYGHATFVELASQSSDDDIRNEVLEPWFVRAALTSAEQIGAVIERYHLADPSGAWLTGLLEAEADIPVEVLAALAGAISATHPAAQMLPWLAPEGEFRAEQAYATRVLKLAAEMVPAEQWPLLARLGANWDGTLGDLVRCVDEVDD